MVRGIEKFKEFFVGYEDNYVIIKSEYQNQIDP